jgi:hypothetical protein
MVILYCDVLYCCTALAVILEAGCQAVLGVGVEGSYFESPELGRHGWSFGRWCFVFFGWSLLDL